MSEPGSRSTRRRVLQGISSAVALSATAGVGAAEGRVDVNVGYKNRRGRQAAARAADRTLREFNFDAVTIRAAPQAADALQRNPHIRYVETNGKLWPISQTTPYGVEQVDADRTISDGRTGNGVSVAVLDTGVDPDHSDLAANIGQGIDCGGGAVREAVADDDGTHGTHIAGTVGAADNDGGVVGVAPEVTLHSVKVLGDDGGTYDTVAAGIEASADAGHRVQNMSFGGSYSYVVKDAMQYAADVGVVMVAAAGNSGPCEDCVIFPASEPETIAVSATDQNDDLADFSSTGPEVDIAAPGVDVLSTMSADRYGYGSGTSMATPHVSAAAAVLIAAGVTDREEVRQLLTGSADDIGLRASEQGAGRLNVAAAVGLVESDSETPTESLTVTTTGSTDVTATSATLGGELTELDGVDSATVSFEYGPSGGSLPNSTAARTVSTTGPFGESVDGLDPDTDYAFRAVAETTDVSAAGDTLQFTTDSETPTTENVAPSIETWSVSTRTTGPWFRAAARWSVSDDDGNLAAVSTELLNGGSVVSSVTNTVGGSTASGDEELRTRGDADEIRLTVTDSDGEAASVGQPL